MLKAVVLFALLILTVSTSRSAENFHRDSKSVRLVTPPSNDNFANRKRLAGRHVRAQALNTFASAETGEPEHTGNPPERSVWWTWKAPHDGTLFIDVKPGQELPHLIAVYTGEAIEQLEQVGFEFGHLVLDVKRNTRYQIVVDDSAFGSSTNQIRLRMNLQRPPRNDDLVHHRWLRGTSDHARGSLVGASHKPDELLPYGDSGHSVWWQWIAPSDGRYTFTAVSTNMNPLLALYRNEPGPDALVDLPVTGNGFSQINLPITKGDVWVISVDGKIQTPQDHFKLSVRKTPPPPNDSFANRIPLLNGLGIGSNEGASWESGEPYEDSDSRSSSIWWQLTPASNGWYTIRARVTITNAAPAWTFPGFLEVYTGSDVEALQTKKGNWYYDDGPDFPSYYLLAGTNYALQVNEFGGRFGQVEVTAQCHPSPNNNDFENASIIPPDTDYSVRASTRWATAEPDEPLLDYPFISVWWRMVAASNGFYAVAPDPMIGDACSVYRGDTLSQLTAVENVTSGPTGFVFEATQGTTYYISAQTPFPGYPLLFQISRVAPPADHNFEPVLRLR